MTDTTVRTVATTTTGATPNQTSHNQTNAQLSNGEDEDMADDADEDVDKVDEVPGTDQEDHHNSRRQPERRRVHNRPRKHPQMHELSFVPSDGNCAAKFSVCFDHWSLSQMLSQAQHRTRTPTIGVWAHGRPREDMEGHRKSEGVCKNT